MPSPRFHGRCILGLVVSALAVLAQPPPANAPAPVAPKSGENVPPPPPRANGLGFSGPGAVHGPQWARYQQQATGSAIKAGLIPDLKPLIPDTQLRDTVVILGGDGNYYLTGSSGADIWDHNDGVELWRSADMKKWDYLGLVWTFERDATWQKAWRYHSKPVRALWAPELHYINRLKNYFITFSMPPGDRGILRSTSGRPEGPGPTTSATRPCPVAEARIISVPRTALGGAAISATTTSLPSARSQPLFASSSMPRD